MKNKDHIQEIVKPEIWDEVSLNLLTKMISEFMYEEIIHPEVVEEKGKRKVYRLELKAEHESENVKYQFEAEERFMDSYHVDSETIRRFSEGKWEAAVNPLQFILDIQQTVGMNPLTTGHLIKEYNNTLLADAHIFVKKQKQDVDLADLDYAELEGEMEGHPWITYNKGRIGFDYQDYLSYAPEQKKPIKLSWIAVHQEFASFHAVSGLSHEDLIRKEVGDTIFEQFKEELWKQGLDDSKYFFLPVHEWQWENVIVQFFPGDIAKKAIVPLGDGTDEYLPQQSIRTFVNTSQKEKHHVKLPMSILNTLVYRGLPGERTVVAPTITEYIHKIRDHDPFLRDECRVILPGEVASLNYDHPYYSKLQGAPYQYLEMLGCIWREGIYSFLEEEERAITLASLLYVDFQGKPFIASLIERSGLSPEVWIGKLFQVVLPPLLHYLYQYGTVFSPHGQNTVLILKNSAPHRLAMKDFVDDVNVSQEPLPELQSLPEELKPVLRSETAEGLCQFIFTGLFVCHLRYLADVLYTYYEYPEETFWKQLRKAIEDYQARFPELEERFRLFDLLKPTFTKLCLNRNRIIDYGYEDDDDRPHASEYGEVRNPLYLVSLEEENKEKIGV
ncbi:IucA/IucC family siderophore biosynthesis protein [Paenibacillus alkaliterrae]|uniref:IucA/IucC family protein n=1 Tax=Paenibacillus alkaliterrae TaxID=320909 RepID=UPI001F2FCF95|nr:IucA/IucC family siderophore biosynthesis protein [Paenibacillus alkaliterrae]MCF2938678.1 IucA/IucC family siderophore biosynthesis protein [Paenibacillus alkaliterrae]